MPQTMSNDPDICCHHREHTKYDHVFHVITSFVCLVKKSEPPFLAAPCVHRNRDTGDPSDRSCSRTVRSFALSLCWRRRFATAVWLRWFRRLTRELFSFVLVFVLQRYGCRRSRTARGLAFPLQKLRTLIFDEQGSRSFDGILLLR